MQFKVQKLDKRHNAHQFFSHRIETSTVYWRNGPGEKYEEFLELRQWCWETFGISCERDLYSHLWYRGGNKIYNKFWAWHFSGTDDAAYIYLTEEGYTHYKLKWG